MASEKAVPAWLHYLDLACATLACGLWYATPQWWPLLVALAPWVIRLAVTRRLTRRTAFDLAMVLFLLTAAVAVWAAFDRDAAFARFWLMVGGVLLFYALVNAEPAGNLRVWFLALLGAAVASHFVLTNDWELYPAKVDLVARLGRALQPSLPPLPGPHPNPNVAGATMAMLLPFSGLAVVQSWRRIRAVPRSRSVGVWFALALGLASLLLVILGLFLTVSRSAWIAVAGALLLAGMWLAAGRLSGGSHTARGWIFGGCLALGMAAAARVVLVWPQALTTLLEALPGPSGTGNRAELVRDGVILVRDYPFTGLGLDGFMMAYSSYVKLIHVGHSPHGHNLYLDVAMEQGLPALLIVLAMSATLFTLSFRDQARRDGRRPSSELAAAVLCWLIILLNGLADDPLYNGHAMLFLLTPLAFAGPPETSWTAAARPIGAIALVVMIVIFRGPLTSQLYSNMGAVLQSQAELGVYSWPEWPIQDEVRRQVDLQQTMAAFERALALDPSNPTANRRLGMIELSRGDYQAALVHLEAAYAAEPWSQTTRQLLGEACIANGRLEEGRALWHGVSNREGQLAIRAWWYGHIGEKERAEWMQQAAASRP